MIQVHSLNKIINDYNPKRKRKILIVLDDMITDIMTNKKIQATIKELFIRCRKLNISLVLITQSYFSVLKEVRINSTHYLIMKVYSRKELQNTAINHITIDTTLPADNLMKFRKNFSDSSL